MSELPSAEADFDSAPLSSADRVRLVHAYLTSTPHDGGLGIIPGCREWDLVQSVMALHNHEFNDQWIRLWARHRIASVELEKVRDQVCFVILCLGVKVTMQSSLVTRLPSISSF